MPCTAMFNKLSLIISKHHHTSKKITVISSIKPIYDNTHTNSCYQLILNMLLAVLFTFAAILSCAVSAEVSLKVLTFNIWLSGADVNDGLLKIARQILRSDADIVALQEVESEKVLAELLIYLGSDWQGYAKNKSFPDNGIVTKHKLNKTSCVETGDSGSLGCQIQLHSGHHINFWGVHFDHRDYTPHMSCNKMVTENFQLLAGELELGGPVPGRAQNAQNLAAHPTFKAQLANTTNVPLIVAGDHNTPSHLDWTEATAHTHCGWQFNWPATYMLNERLGLTDAYRYVYPDPLKNPGITWSALFQHFQAYGFTIPAPMDRIDLVHFKGNMSPVTAEVFCDTHLPAPFYADNEWPSDHKATLVTFKMK